MGSPPFKFRQFAALLGRHLDDGKRKRLSRCHIFYVLKFALYRLCQFTDRDDVVSVKRTTCHFDEFHLLHLKQGSRLPGPQRIGKACRLVVMSERLDRQANDHRDTSSHLAIAALAIVRISSFSPSSMGLSLSHG